MASLTLCHAFALAISVQLSPLAVSLAVRLLPRRTRLGLRGGAARGARLVGGSRFLRLNVLGRV